MNNKIFIAYKGNLEVDPLDKGVDECEDVPFNDKKVQIILDHIASLKNKGYAVKIYVGFELSDVPINSR